MLLQQNPHLLQFCEKSHLDTKEFLQSPPSFRSSLPETDLILQILHLQSQLSQFQLENIRLKQESLRLGLQLYSHQSAMQSCIQKDVSDSVSPIQSQISFTASIKPARRNGSSKNHCKASKLVGPTVGQNYCSARDSPIKTLFLEQRSSKKFLNPSLEKSTKFLQISEFTGGPSWTGIECQKECYEIRVPGKIRSTVRRDNSWRCKIARATIDQIWNGTK